MVDQAILVNGSVQDFNDQDEQFKSTIQNLKRFIGASSKKVIDKISDVKIQMDKKMDHM